MGRLVSAFALGVLTPLFGRAWDESIGHSRKKGERFPAAYYLVPLASSLLVTVTMALILAAADPEQPVESVTLGLIVGLGVALAISVNNALTPHTPRPFRHGFITGGYHLVGIVGVTLVLASLGG